MIQVLTGLLAGFFLFVLGFFFVSLRKTVKLLQEENERLLVELNQSNDVSVQWAEINAESLDSALYWEKAANLALKELVLLSAPKPEPTKTPFEEFISPTKIKKLN